MDLNTFLATASKMIMKWSKARDPNNVNFRSFSNEPSIRLNQWTDGYNWKKEAEIKILDDVNVFYVASRENNVIITTEVINKYESLWLNCNFTSFEQFVDAMFGYWRITLNKDNWKLSTCSCPMYFKRYMCKHIIGVSLRSKLVKAPNAAKLIPLNQTRGVGRPRLAASALIYQAHSFKSLLEYENQDNDKCNNPILIPDLDTHYEINDSQAVSVTQVIEQNTQIKKKRGRKPGTLNKATIEKRKLLAEQNLLL